LEAGEVDLVAGALEEAEVSVSAIPAVDGPVGSAGKEPQANARVSIRMQRS
jgi:hypothetical protein